MWCPRTAASAASRPFTPKPKLWFGVCVGRAVGWGYSLNEAKALDLPIDHDRKYLGSTFSRWILGFLCSLNLIQTLTNTAFLGPGFARRVSSPKKADWKSLIDQVIIFHPWTDCRNLKDSIFCCSPIIDGELDQIENFGRFPNTSTIRKSGDFS